MAGDGGFDSCRKDFIRSINKFNKFSIHYRPISRVSWHHEGFVFPVIQLEHMPSGGTSLTSDSDFRTKRSDYKVKNSTVQK